MIDGYTKTLGLIGDPVEHTLSPLIHNTLSQKFGHNLIYVPFHVQKELIENAIKGAYSLNILGLNITYPYKTQVMNYLVDIDDIAKQIGSVNTLVRFKNGYKGYNTDMPGLYRALLSENIKVEGSDIIILGAGGAARSATFMCAFYKANKVYLLNRTLEKAEKIANEVNNFFRRNCIFPLKISDHSKLPNKKFFVIQATSVGLFPDVDNVVIDDETFYEKIHTALDLIYKPKETKFLRLVKQHGGKTLNGLKMLLYQGIIAYELWNEVSVSDEIANSVLDELNKS